MTKRGIIIANTGTPDDPSPEAVKRYLKQFLSNQRIVYMNRIVWSIILNCFILPKRSVSSSEKYKTIWKDDGFKFKNDHFALARELEASYRADGEDVCVRVGMSFGNPSIESAMQELHDAGCEELIVVPLYPQSAFSTDLVVEDEIKEKANATGWTGKWHRIDGYADNERYIEAIVDSIKDSGYNADAGDRLLILIHSIPYTDINKGDTYEQQVKETVRLIVQKMDLGEEGDKWQLAYHCRFDNDREWLSPFVQTVVEGFAEDDPTRNIYAICPGFSVDCLETYFDIEQELKKKWDEIGKSDLVYIPCLNASVDHVAVLRDVIDNFRN